MDLLPLYVYSKMCKWPLSRTTFLKYNNLVNVRVLDYLFICCKANDKINIPLWLSICLKELRNIKLIFLLTSCSMSFSSDFCQMFAISNVFFHKMVIKYLHLCKVFDFSSIKSTDFWQLFLLWAMNFLRKFLTCIRNTCYIFLLLYISFCHLPFVLPMTREVLRHYL